MINYNLASLASRRAGTVVELPQIHGTVATEQAYLKALRLILRQIAAALREEVFPVIEREIAQKAAATRLVGDIDTDVFARLRTLADLFSTVAVSRFGDILKAETKRHTKAFAGQIKSLFSVDLSAIVR